MTTTFSLVSQFFLWYPDVFFDALAITLVPLQTGRLWASCMPLIRVIKILEGKLVIWWSKIDPWFMTKTVSLITSATLIHCVPLPAPHTQESKIINYPVPHPSAALNYCLYRYGKNLKKNCSDMSLSVNFSGTWPSFHVIFLKIFALFSNYPLLFLSYLVSFW